MKQLTEDQIKDLESRGIKPGVKLRCASKFANAFRFENWDDVQYSNDPDSVMYKDIWVNTPVRSFIYMDMNAGEIRHKYATPIQ